MPFTRLRQSMIKPNGSITGSLSGTSSYSRRALTASYALNSSGGGGGGSVQTGSIAKQTVWTNVTSGSTNTITSLNLSSNKWDVSVVEEWDAATLDQYYNSCSLLCHFNGVNGSTTFTDNSKNNTTFTVNGNSQISILQSKFGGASAYFDGTGDYLSSPSVSDFAFGTGNFTIECWIYSSDVSFATQRGFLQTSDTVGGLKTSFTTGIIIGAGSPVNGALFATVAGTNVGSSTAVITTNTWYHIALVRNSGTSTLYVNGTSVGSASTTGNCSGTYLAIGGYYNTSYLYQGYLDELRITKGVARYTSNFTPQKYEFPNSRNQVLTRYVGLVGGIDDKYVDYGVQKLSNSSLKLTRLTYPNQPLIGSGSLSGSVSRVYVNVLDYTNVSVTSSYSLNSINSLDIPKIKSIIYTNSSYTPTTASAVDLAKPNTSYITISGSNFKPSASVFIDNTSGSIVTYVNSNKLNVNVISKNIGTYPIYLSNTDGASTFKINAITYIYTGYTIGYLIVAGGGAGGSSGPNDNRGGGGGGGGFVSGSMMVYKTGSFVVTVGSGGSVVTPSGTGTNGNTSSLGSNIIALGGGGGGGAATTGRSGGSGGGGGASLGPGNWSGGAGSQPSQAYGGFGNAGGTGGTNNVNYRSGGGGGGAGGIGGDASISSATGGVGKGSYLTGSLKYYSGGGGTSNGSASPQGGGGNNGQPGSVNTGGGGGGGSSAQQGGAGGSGIVILRYSGPQKGTGGTIKELGGYTIHTFFTSGTFTP